MINRENKDQKKVETAVSSSQKEVETSFESQFNRMLMAVDAKSDTDLARALNLQQSAISSAKSRSKVPSAWFMLLSENYNVSADWLIYGIGTMRRGETSQTEEQRGNATDRPKIKMPGDALKQSGLPGDMLKRYGMPGDMLSPSSDNEAYFRQEIVELRKEWRELLNENKELRKENKELIEQNAELRIENEKLKLKPDRDKDRTNEDDERRIA